MRIPSYVVSFSLMVCVSSPAWSDSFSDALALAYLKNPQIEAERARLETLDEGVAQALSGYRPNLSATYDGGKHRTAFDGQDWSNAHYNNQSVSLTQPLFKGGATYAGVKSAKQRVLAGRWALSALEQQVLLEAVKAYMGVVANHAICELSKNNQEVLARQLKAAQDRFAVGEVTRTDVAQSEARLSDAKAQVITAEGELAVSIATYERLVGQKPSGEMSVPEHLPDLPATLEDALAKAYRVNPEVLSATHMEKSANYDVRVREAALLPQVALVGSMERQDGSGALGNAQMNTDTVGVSVQIPLYQAGAEYSQVRSSESAARRQKHVSMDTRRAVEEGVTQAWQGVETARATIESRRNQIEASEIALKGVRQEQEYGARTVLDVLDAEQELFTARTNYIRAQKDYIIATYSLAMHLGEMTPKALDLPVKTFDATKHYEEVKSQWIGF